MYTDTSTKKGSQLQVEDGMLHLSNVTFFQGILVGRVVSGNNSFDTSKE